MKKQFLFHLLFLSLAVYVYGGGNKEKSSIEKSSIIEITGIVRLVGSDPVSELVISGLDREWYITKEEEHKLKSLQYQMVTVKAEETIINLTFANGLPAGERRVLKRITIVDTSIE